MSSPYEPIPTNSDDENDHVSETEHMSEDDAGTDRTRSTERTHFMQPRTADSDEDPSEDPSEDSFLSPLPHFNSETRTPIRRTARASVAMPNVDRWTRSAPSTPPTDPYIRPPPGFHVWDRTLNLLHRWRSGGQYTSTSGGVGSPVRQEFLLDTTPIIVDKIARHDEKLDMMENIIMDMPGAEALGELQNQVNDAEENISSVNDTVQILKAKLERLTMKYEDMRDEMDRKVGECHTMTEMAQGFAQDRVKEFFKNKGK